MVHCCRVTVAYLHQHEAAWKLWLSAQPLRERDHTRQPRKRQLQMRFALDAWYFHTFIKWKESLVEWSNREPRIVCKRLDPITLLTTFFLIWLGFFFLYAIWFSAYRIILSAHKDYLILSRSAAFCPYCTFCTRRNFQSKAEHKRLKTHSNSVSRIRGKRLTTLFHASWTVAIHTGNRLEVPICPYFVEMASYFIFNWHTKRRMFMGYDITLQNIRMWYSHQTKIISISTTSNIQNVLVVRLLGLAGLAILKCTRCYC